MSAFTRRSVIRSGAAVTAAGIADPFGFARAWAQAAPWKPEAGASLSLMRWKRFVQGEDDAFMRMVAAFTQATGVKINVTNESFDDIQPKASVAANTGQGPDIIWGLRTLAHLFPQRCVDVSDVADYLAKKYGGFSQGATPYGKLGDKWIAIPVAFTGGAINYRIQAVAKAGFKEFPKDHAGFLELCRGLKKNNTPAGFAIGHATGDANSWVHWALWSHNSFLVDAADKVIINSPETAKALEYCKSLYETFVPGTISWNDASNNKAFLAGELFLTSNGISIYAAAQAGAKVAETADAGAKEAARKLADIAADMNHAAYPIGPAGKPTESTQGCPIMIFNYTKAPNAAKAFLAYMMEAENHGPWLEGAEGYLTHSLNVYDKHPVWTADPKRTPFRDCGHRSLSPAGLGTVGEKSATALAEFILVDMVAGFCTGRSTAAEAMAAAERQAKRIYR
jgi:multiple sugar transport system substrate-binding protein